MNSLSTKARALLFWLILSTVAAWPLAAQDDAPQETPDQPRFSSVEERRIYASIQEERENLQEEKKALDFRENELKTLEAAVDKKLAELDERLAELRRQQDQLAKLLEEKDQAEQLKIQSLSKIYEKMNPAKAALAISGLDQQLAADLLANMKVKAAAAILDNLNKPAATEISKTFSTIQLE